MIYVTVGTMYLDFARLVRAMDLIAEGGGERVLIQTGLGRSIPRHADHFDFKPRGETLALQREARLIVCHAGIGAVMDALQVRRPFLVVPRLKRFGEHNSDHQLDLARRVHERGWGRMILDTADLPDACANPPSAKQDYRPAKEPLVHAIRRALGNGA